MIKFKTMDSTQPKSISVQDIILFRSPPWALRLTVRNDRSYPRIKIVRAAPLSFSDRFISILDDKDVEIGMIDDLAEVDADTRALIEEELEKRYLTSIVKEIISIQSEYGTSYWEVETDRGRRDFVVQNVSENAQWPGDRRLLLLDVDGNRFDIPDLDALDSRSRKLVENLL